jgi:hypothetical protein
MLTWSTHLHSAALLDLWIGPKPVVVDYVRRQLMIVDEKQKIRSSIDRRKRGKGHKRNLYDMWLFYTGLDFENEGPDLTEAIENNDLRQAFFDLVLGQRVKAFQLCPYVEVYAARALIESFILDFDCCMVSPMPIDCLWWDGINANGIPPKPWVSVTLRDDDDFLPILESWHRDSEHLQTWLDSLEAETLLVNNPKEKNRVFSETTAVEVLKWAKVGHPNRG